MKFSLTDTIFASISLMHASREYPTQNATAPQSGWLPIAVYNDAGQKLFQVNLDTSKDGPTSAILEKPVSLQPGTYSLAWAAPAANLPVSALGIGREERDVLNAGEGAIVVGLAHGRRDYQLPDKLGELELPPERFGLVPQIYFKG
jgi:hypothetical protein